MSEPELCPKCNEIAVFWMSSCTRACLHCGETWSDFEEENSMAEKKYVASISGLTRQEAIELIENYGNGSLVWTMPDGKPAPPHYIGTIMAYPKDSVCWVCPEISDTTQTEVKGKHG